MDMNHEHAVLGAAIIAPEWVPIICGELEAEDFYTPQAATVFLAIKAMFDAGMPIDLATLDAELGKKNKLESVGGLDYLFALSEYPVTTTYTQSYIEKLHDSRCRRIFARGMREAIDSAENGDDDFLAIEADTMSKVNSIGSTDMESTLDYMPIVVNRLGDTSRGVTTGFNTFDYVCGGFGKGDLVILAARPSVGKTALACNIAVSMAKRRMVVPYFSLEMSKAQITERMLLSESMVDRYEARNGGQAMTKVIDTMGNITWRVHVDDRVGLSAGQISSACHKLKRRTGKIDCVFVDYLQLMKLSSNKKLNINNLVGENSRAMKNMARTLECPVVLLCQLRRDAQDRRPNMADLRDSGEIEQDADIILLLHREKDNPAQTTVIIEKNRNGKTGDIDLVWKPEHTRFYDPQFADATVPKGVFND